MNINVSSWHYRFLDTMFDSIPRSLCPYFWKVIWGLVLVSLGLFVVIGMCGVTGAKLLVAVGLYGGLVSFIASPFLGALVIASCIAIMVGFFIAWDHMKEKRRTAAYEKRVAMLERSETPKESLVGSFLKAKKEKICPSLNFVE